MLAIIKPCSLINEPIQYDVNITIHRNHHQRQSVNMFLKHSPIHLSTAEKNAKCSGWDLSIPHLLRQRPV